MFNRRLLIDSGGGHLNPRCQQRKLYCGRVALKILLLSLSQQV